ncbi:hypothetical protein COO60DRAFT_1600751, partial [Scenedesmus sp. NREL 46B-D3]
MLSSSGRSSMTSSNRPAAAAAAAPPLQPSSATPAQPSPAPNRLCRSASMPQLSTCVKPPLPSLQESPEHAANRSLMLPSRGSASAAGALPDAGAAACCCVQKLVTAGAATWAAGAAGVAAAMAAPRAVLLQLTSKLTRWLAIPPRLAAEHSNDTRAPVVVLAVLQSKLTRCRPWQSKLRRLLPHSRLGALLAG